MMKRWLGVPFLYSAASAAVGFSIYFSIGVVADRGLGLTPVIFLLAGLMFALTSLSYVEGGAMLRERGGSATFARHAFNELISFIAGWAILIDYLIVIAAASITVSHYLTPISGSFGGGDVELAVAALVIALAAILNIADVTGRNRQRRLVVLALAELGLQLLVIVVGLIVVLHPDRLTDQLHLFTSPTVKDLVYSLVIATIAYAGIEAASDLAPELEFEPGDLKRVLGVGAIAIPLIYAGIAAVALMAVPVEPTAHGPQTALAGRYIEEPILGVVANYDHGFLSDLMKWAVMLVAVPVLFWAANGAMLGLSRHVYVLATNRQIPSWAGKLESNYSTPYIAIGIAAVLALALAIPGDIRFLARVYAFGALLAVTIAQISIVRLRVVEPDLERPYRVPWNVRFGSHELPLLSIIGALISGLAWISVFLLHHTAVWVGGGWMLFGLVFYVIYRRYVEGTPLTRRVQVPEASLKKQPAELEYSTILVPVFGTQARRRHRQHGGPARGRFGGRGRAAASARRRLRGRGAAHGPARLAPVEGRPGARREGARAGAGDRGRVRERRGDDEPAPGALDGVRHRAGGAGQGGRGDRDGRRAADARQGRRDPRRDRRRSPGRDRRGDRVRVEEGALPRAADGATGGGRTRPEPESGRGEELGRRAVAPAGAVLGLGRPMC